MSRVTRGTPAGGAYLDLQNQARRSGRPTQELLQLYVLEGFLARLVVSDLRHRFVLKGGLRDEVDEAGRRLVVRNDHTTNVK